MMISMMTQYLLDLYWYLFDELQGRRVLQHHACRTVISCGFVHSSSYNKQRAKEIIFCCNNCKVINMRVVFQCPSIFNISSLQEFVV